MRARDALIVWNEREVKIMDINDRNRRDNKVRYPHCGGAAFRHWREGGVNLLRMFKVLTVDFGIDPNVVNDAFYRINEYDRMIMENFKYPNDCALRGTKKEKRI